MDRGTEGQARIEMRDGRGSTKFQCPKLWAAVPPLRPHEKPLGEGFLPMERARRLHRLT